MIKHSESVCLAGAAVRAARLALRQTQQEVAAALTALMAVRPADFLESIHKADYSTISHMERAQPCARYSRVHRDTAAALAEVLGVPTDELLFDEQAALAAESVVPPREQSAPAPSDAQLVGPVTTQVTAELPYISVSGRSIFYDAAGEVLSFLITEKRRVYLRGTPTRMYENRIVFEVDGDLMEPYISSGDEVIAVPVPVASWELEQNAIYVIAYAVAAAGVVTIKKIVENELASRGILTLRPYRADLAPSVVRRADIRAIYRVERIMPRCFEAHL